MEQQENSSGVMSSLNEITGEQLCCAGFTPTPPAHGHLSELTLHPLHRGSSHKLCYSLGIVL